METRVALVTGGASGIGRAAAARLGRAGHKVIVADLNAEAAQAAAEALAEQGLEAAAQAVDVADAGQVETLVAKTVARFGRLDALVNSAGRGLLILPPCAALQSKIVPGKARGAGPSPTRAKPRNAAWRDFGRNPKGRGHFCAMRRCGSLT